MFEFLVFFFHTLPDAVLGPLGQLSDVISDMAPEFLRDALHVLFTALLN